MAAINTLARFFVLVWHTSRALALWGALLRLVRAFLPILALYIGKLVIDAVVVQIHTPQAPENLSTWLESAAVVHLSALVALELVIALISELAARAALFVDTRLIEAYRAKVGAELIEQVAQLPLVELETSDEQNRIERARRQVIGRSNFITQSLNFVPSNTYVDRHNCFVRSI